MEESHCDSSDSEGEDSEGTSTYKPEIQTSQTTIGAKYEHKIYYRADRVASWTDRIFVRMQDQESRNRIQLMGDFNCVTTIPESDHL